MPCLDRRSHCADKEQVGGIARNCQTSAIVSNVVHCAKLSLTAGIAW